MMRFFSIFLFFATALGADESVLEIVSSPSHTMLLLADGSVFASGLNTVGQLGSPVSALESLMKEASLSQIKDMAAGDGTSLWIDSTGQLWGAGNSEYGELLQDGGILSTPTVIWADASANLVDIGEHFVALLDSNGDLWTWGIGSSGQLGDGTSSQRSTAERIAQNVTDVACGSEHLLYVTTTGELWGAGNNARFALGQVSSTSTPVQLDTDVAQVAAGSDHSIYLKTNGSVWVMGAGDRGQLGDGTSADITTAKQVVNSGIQTVAAGREHSLILTLQNNLFGCGANDRGQLGTGTTLDASTFKFIAEDISIVWADDQRSFTVNTEGEVYSVGDNPYGQLGVGLVPLAQDWTSVVNSGVKSVSASRHHSLVILNNGSLLGAGDTKFGDGSVSTTPSTLVSANVTQATAGITFSMFIETDGSVWAFGSNPFGQFGNDSTFNATSPVKVHDGPASQVSLGDSHSLLLLSDGTLWAAGDNSFGQLGSASSSLASSQVWVQALSDVTSISAGAFHSIALKTDGSIWTFGRNTEGQLGIGSTNTQTSPISIAENGNTIHGAWLSSYLIDTSGNLYGFGFNGRGQLGTGDTVNPSSPTLISENVASVTASETHAIFQRQDGSAQTMGTGYLTPNATSLNQTQLTPSALTLPANSTLPLTLTLGGQDNNSFIWSVDASGNAMGLGYHESSTLGLGQQDYRTLPVFIGGGSAIVTSTANIVVQEAEVLEVDEDEVLETDEILDQSDAGPQLIQVSKSAGGCLLR